MVTKLVCLLMAALSGGIFSGHAYSALYPLRPIRIVVPVSAGGALDLVSRIVAEQLSVALRQSVIVENRPGAGGTIALGAVASSNADGYTLVTMSDSLPILPLIYSNLSFDPETSFAPIILMTKQAVVLAVHPSVPVTNFAQFVALAKGSPGSLTFGTGSAAQHLIGELIKQRSGINMTHVPYKGASPAIVNLMGGQIASAVLGASTVIPKARAGRVRILAVTSSTRSAALSEIPTLAESGLSGFDVTQWISLFAPAKTPSDVIALLNSEVKKVLEQPVVHERLTKAGLEVEAASASQVKALIRDEYALWRKLVKDTGLKLKY